MPQFFNATHPFTLSSHDEIVADIHRALQYCYGQYAHQHKIGEAGVSLVVTPRGAHGGTIHITSEVAPYEHDMMMEENTVLAHRYLPEREVREVERKDQDEAEDYCEELVEKLIAQMEEDGADREDNPAKFRTEQYDGSTEKRIYPEDIAKVYPALRGAMRSLTKHERGEVINLLWSFIAATIEESPILQKAGWAVGREPDGDNFAVYYETCPRGQSFEDIIEQDAILAVKEAAGGRSDNPRKSGLPLGSLALGAALGAAAMHFTMKPKQ
jgi:hypothetical protein